MMKKLIAILAFCMAVMMLVSLSACGKKADTAPSETTAETTAATTAPTTAATAAPAATEKSQSPASSPEAQIETISPDQQEYVNQQKALQAVLYQIEQIYGQGDWRIDSIAATTDSSGNDCYYVGASDWSTSQSAVHYFYVSPGAFCYEDETSEADRDWYNTEEQQDYMRQQKAIQEVIETVVQQYGEGDWRIDSIDHASTGYYVGVSDWSTSQSPIHYYYVDPGNYCYEAE